MRQIRKQPFCWQEKKINRLIREKFKERDRVKMLLLYSTITEIDSDFNGKDIKYYTKTISTYSGLNKGFIPTGLKYLEEMNIIKIIEDRNNGKFKGKRLIFTPEKIKETNENTITDFDANGENINGKEYTSEDSLIKEDSLIEENNNNINNKNFQKKEIIDFTKQENQEQKEIPKEYQEAHNLIESYKIEDCLNYELVTKKGFSSMELMGYVERMCLWLTESDKAKRRPKRITSLLLNTFSKDRVDWSLLTLEEKYLKSGNLLRKELRKTHTSSETCDILDQLWRKTDVHPDDGSR